MPNVSVKVDGIMLLTLLAVGAAVVIYTQRDALLEAVNPTSQKNLANQAAEGVIGVDNLQTALTPIFKAWDWVND